MFGRQAKQCSQAVALRPYSYDEAQLPPHLRAVLRYAETAQVELTTLEQTQREIELPGAQAAIYRERIKVLRQQVKGLGNIQWALELGYEPYSIPEGWCVGMVQSPLWRVALVQSQFQAPMPKEVLLRYAQAQATRIFVDFLVASPDGTLFRFLGPLCCEPVLVGLVRIGAEQIRVNSIVQYPLDRREPNGADRMVEVHYSGLDGAVSFLIAHWDLGRDLTFQR